MKRLLFALSLIVCLLCTAGLPAAAHQNGDIVGTLSRAPKSPADEAPYITQCELGSAVTDAVREYAGTDIALVPSALLAGALPSGNVTWDSVQAVFSENRQLAVAELTPRTLYDMLEAAVSRLRLDTVTELIVEGSETFGGFCQISGFSFRYDVSAPVGERVLRVTLDDGTELSNEDAVRSLTLAAPAYLLEGKYGFPPVAYSALDGTLANALADYIAAHAALPQSTGTRIDMIGARNRSIVSIFPKGTLTGGVAVLIVLLVLRRSRYGKIKDEYGTNTRMVNRYV